MKILLEEIDHSGTNEKCNDDSLGHTSSHENKNKEESHSPIKDQTRVKVQSHDPHIGLIIIQVLILILLLLRGLLKPVCIGKDEKSKLWEFDTFQEGSPGILEEILEEIVVGIVVGIVVEIAVEIVVEIVAGTAKKEKEKKERTD